MHLPRRGASKAAYLALDVHFVNMHPIGLSVVRGCTRIRTSIPCGPAERHPTDFALSYHPSLDPSGLSAFVYCSQTPSSVSCVTFSWTSLLSMCWRHSCSRLTCAVLSSWV